MEGQKKGAREIMLMLRIFNTKCLNYFSYVCDKISGKKKPLQKGSVYFGSSWQRRHGGGSRWLAVTLLPEGRWKVDPDCKTSRHVPKNLLPLKRLHFLKVWQFSYRVQTSGDLMFKLSIEEFSHSNQNESVSDL